MTVKKPSAIDLFCGAGGLTTGLKAAGFSVLAGFELNETAAATYKLNHKKSKIFIGDLSKIDPKKVMDSLGLEQGELDLLAGCPPCQGFSTHKTRNRSSSVDDIRNDLVFEVLRYIKVFLPKTIMLENVPGLAKDKRMLKLKEELNYLGYVINDNTVKVLDAADFGVPQRRKRMILQASLFGIINEPDKIKIRTTVKQSIGALPIPGFSGDELHDLPVLRSEKVSTIIENIPTNGGSRSDLPIELWLPCHIKRPGSYKDVYGRMSWDDVAPTITGGCTNPSKGRFIHPDQNRSITLREAALLQTFPKKYKFSLSRGKDYAALMIGNALPPLLIKAHALKYIQHLKSIETGNVK
ncbi:DNA cytosine methyltransferase [Pseudomonas edaphica]|uniref:Cytosine-specific methyltransferase n=1 Tax=Pseudomonas edaphica TaxID=2006980 RepID=A0ABY2U0E6_9PSED|nr:DNA cytosine methyltransferase [Pseudomonas edaphica]TLG89459.1 DNA cytosine methyltransferase [Pseudomonas edaphica]